MCVPAVRELVLNVAVLPAIVTPDASVAFPSVKLSVPVGVPAPGGAALTVAVKTTAWPCSDGLGDEATATVLEATLTCCGADESSPMLVWKLPSPEYEAVIVWLPTASAVVLNVATPPASSTLDTSVVLPSVKLIDPVGMPPAGAVGLTTAVKVVVCPKNDGPGDDVTAMLVPAGFTTCGTAESSSELGRKLPSPEYEAAIVWLPADSPVVLNVATPLVSGRFGASVALPSVKLTVPVGVPAPGDTALRTAVNVIACA